MGLPAFGLRGVLYVSIGILFFLNACDEPGVIGLEVHPQGELLGAEFYDETPLVSFTVKEDSLRADEPLLQLVGSYMDPVFGYAAASSYIEFSLPTNNVNFGSNFTPDSLVLYLGYNGFYGDAVSAQTLMAYQLTEEIHADSSYYSTKNFSYDPSPLSTQTIAPLDGDTMVKIKFDSPIFTSVDSEFVDNAGLQAFLKGFYLTTDTTVQGGILYFNMLSQYTKLTLYYNDSMSFDFIIDSESARSNHFTHSYSGTDVEAQLNDTALGESLVYVQPMGGVKTEIQFPFLKNWANSGSIVVNKAELVLQVEASSQVESYSPPEFLFIMGAGETAAIVDQYEGASYFGGEYDAINGEYRFNIARHVHGIINGEIQNEGLLLLVPNNLLLSGSVVSGNRVVLGGAKSTTGPMKLEIVYTQL